MVVPNTHRIALWLDFYPPDRRARDDDNMIASFKAGRDGIALALGINDKRFITHPMVMDQIGGFIKVRLSASVALVDGPDAALWALDELA